MPFTFAHPAIVLPLKKVPGKYLSLTGLVIGTMLPDFEYFLRMNMRSEYSHTLPGLLWFCLPLGILLAFIFHNIVRNKLIDNLPGVLRRRFGRFCGFDWNGYFRRYWYVAVWSILLGAVTHVFWDSFTHETGYFVRMWPTLAGTVGSYGVPVYKILQHGSTLAGFAVIFFFIYSMPTSGTGPDKDTSRSDWQYWPVVIGIVLIMVAARLLTGLSFRAYGIVIVTAISGLMLGLVLAPLLLYRKK